MGRTLTTMLRELRSDKDTIDWTILTLERLVRERDKKSRKPVSDGADGPDRHSQYSAQEGNI